MFGSFTISLLCNMILHENSCMVNRLGEERRVRSQGFLMQRQSDGWDKLQVKGFVIQVAGIYSVFCSKSGKLC